MKRDNGVRLKQVLKGNVVPAHAMKVRSASRGIAALITDLGTSWK
jgi:hypothetical protein